MVDLETLDNVASAAIMSIGAVAFDPLSDKIEHEFYIVINTKSCVDAGLSLGKETMDWWAKQEPEARKVLSESRLSPVTLEEGLSEFTKWFKKVHGRWLWGNGASFDNAIMSHAYRRAGLEPPWDWWNDRCYRTLKEMADKSIKITRGGVYHNALDDAKDQAIHMQKFMGGRPVIEEDDIPF